MEYGENETNNTSDGTGIENDLGLDSAKSPDRVLMGVLHLADQLFEQDALLVAPEEKKEEIRIICELIKQSPQYRLLDLATGYLSADPYMIRHLLFSDRSDLTEEERKVFDPSFRAFPQPPLFDPFEPDAELKEKLLRTAEVTSQKSNQNNRNLLSKAETSRRGLLDRFKNRREDRTATSQQGAKGLLTEREQMTLLSSAYEEMMGKIGNPDFLQYPSAKHRYLIESESDNYNINRIIAEELQDRGYEIKSFSVGNCSVYLLGQDARNLYSQISGSPEISAIELAEGGDIRDLQDLEELLTKWSNQGGIPQEVDLTDEEKRSILTTSLMEDHASLLSLSLEDEEFEREHSQKLKAVEEAIAALDAQPLNQPQLRTIIQRLATRAIR